MKISLCMIVKDEEEVLERCLKSALPLADEIIVADTGSRDGTKALAEKFGAQVYDFAWRDDFAAARNFAFSKGTGDYLMWLDADDVIAEEADPAGLRERLEREAPDIVMCPYRIGGEGGTVFLRERFLKRSEHFVWQGRVHECIAPHGKRIDDPFTVIHLGSAKPRGDRNLRIYRKWAQEEKLGGRDLFYFGRELFYNGFYGEAVRTLEEMLEGDGWYVNKIEACKILSLCRGALKDRNGERLALLRSFLYGEPRASVLCALGRSFCQENRLREGAFWYEGALACRDHTAEGDFEEPSCRALVPCLGLVFCYYRLGEREKAAEYHRKTEALAPCHPSVRYNRRFFE